MSTIKLIKKYIDNINIGKHKFSKKVKVYEVDKIMKEYKKDMRHEKIISVRGNFLTLKFKLM